MMVSLCLFLGVVTQSTRWGVAADGHTLDDFTGFESSEHLVRSTVDGEVRLAWVAKKRGVVNLWAADGDWQPWQLTHNTEDEGMDGFGFLRFTADGSALVYSVSFTDSNPNHLVAPTSSSTFTVPFRGGAPVRLANETAVELSANSRHILYCTSAGAASGSALWQQELRPGGEAKELFRVKQGSLSSFAWGPHGTLAFANDRGDHSFVGLLSPFAGSLLWLSPSVDSDTQPAWSPGGSRLAWIRARLPSGNVGYSPFDGNMGNRGPNFGVMVAEVTWDEAGAPHAQEALEVFTDNTHGMLSFGYGDRPLTWAEDDKLVFGTEAISSWGHAVVVDLSVPGAGPRELLPGKCEDTAWTLGSDGWLYVANNCGNLDGSGIERVSLSNGTREDLVPVHDAFTVAGVSNSGSGMVVVSGFLVFLSSSYDSPCGVRALALSGGASFPVTQNSGFAKELLVRPQILTFPSADGLFTLHAQLFLPSGANGTAEVPGIVYTHGGSERQMYGAFHFSAIYAQHYAMNQWLAHTGVAVLSVNYRSGTGYGHGFRVCEHCMARGAAEYQDVREAAVQLASTAGVDGERIGIWGLSYGGLNAEQACARDSQLFKACVAIAGIFNWITQQRYQTDTGLSVIDMDIEPSLPGGFRSLPIGPEPAWAGPEWQGQVSKLQALMFDSSPAGHVQTLTSPLLLIQGDADEEVSFQESVGAVRAVRALGRDNVQSLVFPDETHGCATYSHQMQSLEATKKFLFEHLRSGAVLV